MIKFYKDLKKLVVVFLVVFVASLSASIFSNKVKHELKSLLLKASNDSKATYTAEILNREADYLESPSPQLVKINILKSIKDKLKESEEKEQAIVLSAINDDFFASIDELIDARGQGAICDGKTDDTEALQRALNKIARLGGGGYTFLKESA